MEVQMHKNVDKHWIAMLWIVDMSVMNIIYTYVCEVLLGLQDLIWKWRQLLFKFSTQKQYIFESDQHATGSCRPDVVLVPFSLFLGWVLLCKPSPTPIHHKDLNWGRNCCDIDTQKQQTFITLILHIFYCVLLIYQYIFYFKCMRLLLQYLDTL